jgi:tetratricopeptide (TPR) repeat protein
MREAASWSDQIGDKDRAHEILLTVLADPETAFDRAEALRMLAQLSFERGDNHGAIRNYEAAIQTLRTTGDFPGLYDSLVASIRSNLSLAYRSVGNTDASRRISEEVIAMDATRIDRFSKAAALSNLAAIAAARGDYEAATHHLDERISLYAGEDRNHEERISLVRDELAAKAGLPNLLEARLLMRTALLDTPGTVTDGVNAGLGLLELLRNEARTEESLSTAVDLLRSANAVLDDESRYSPVDHRAARNLRTTCLSLLSTAYAFGHPDKAIDAIAEMLRAETDPGRVEQLHTDLRSQLERANR